MAAREASMTAKEFSKIAERLLRCPTAPFHEHVVRDEVERICTEQGVSFRRDAFGNVIAQYRSGNRVRPLVLAAHMDHPGFEVVRGSSATTLRVRFEGGVPDEYFRRGTRLRLIPGGDAA